jgi:hypothetical protein
LSIRYLRIRQIFSIGFRSGEFTGHINLLAVPLALSAISGPFANPNTTAISSLNRAGRSLKPNTPFLISRRWTFRPVITHHIFCHTAMRFFAAISPLEACYFQRCHLRWVFFCIIGSNDKHFITFLDIHVLADGGFSQSLPYLAVRCLACMIWSTVKGF